MDFEKEIKKYIENFRFQIVDDKGVQRSSTWTIRQNKSEDSIFIYSIAHGEKMKLSLHPRNTSRDGNDAQWGLKNKHIAELREKGFITPKPVRWKRPYDENKVKKVATLLFPTEYMTENVYQFVGKKKPKINIPMAAFGNAAEVSLFYLYNNQNPDEVAEQLFKKFSYTPIFYITLTTGEIVNIAIRQIPFDKKIIPKPDTYHGYKLTNEKINSSEFIHCLLFNHPQDGEPFQLCEINGVNVDI